MGGCKALSPRMEGAVSGGMFPRKNFEIWKIGDALSSILVIEESAV